MFVVAAACVVFFCRMEVPATRRKPRTVKARGPSDARTAQILSIGTRQRNPERKSPSRAGRKAQRPGGLRRRPTHGRSLPRPTPRKTTRCVPRRGAESQRGTRQVSNHLTHISSLLQPSPKASNGEMTATQTNFSLLCEEAIYMVFNNINLVFFFLLSFR